MHVWGWEIIVLLLIPTAEFQQDVIAVMIITLGHTVFVSL
jgi:hypothetical protein